jgi:hypothetical protein
MKHIILVLVALMVTVTQAQEKFVDQDYCVLQDGEVIVYKDGMPSALDKTLQLNNGFYVKPDGTYIVKNGKVVSLKEGECLGMSGKLYASEEKLNVKVQQHKKKLLKKKG